MQKALEQPRLRDRRGGDGAEAIRKAQARCKPDLILMDIVMPGVNGFQATRELANDPRHAAIPVIMVTTKGQETDRIWGMRQGAVDYLVKPVSTGNSWRRRRPLRCYAAEPMTDDARTLRAPARPAVRAVARAGARWRAARCTGQERDAAASANGSASRSASGGETFLVAREETREVLGCRPS